MNKEFSQKLKQMFGEFDRENLYAKQWEFLCEKWWVVEHHLESVDSVPLVLPQFPFRLHSAASDRIPVVSTQRYNQWCFGFWTPPFMIGIAFDTGEYVVGRFKFLDNTLRLRKTGFFSSINLRMTLREGVESK